MVLVILLLTLHSYSKRVRYTALYFEASSSSIHCVYEKSARLRGCPGLSEPLLFAYVQVHVLNDTPNRTRKPRHPLDALTFQTISMGMTFLQ